MEITMEKIYRAGIIPFFVENEEIQMLFMKPSDPTYGGEYFQIAKGKVDDGETNEEAALREGFEELGLLKDNIDELFDLGSYLGRTNIFLARIKNKDNFTNFHFETAETRWLTLYEFKSFGRNLHYSVVQTAIDYITVSKE